MLFIQSTTGLERHGKYRKKIYDRCKNSGRVRESNTLSIINGELEVQALNRYVATFLDQDRVCRFWRKTGVNEDDGTFHAITSKELK